MTLDTNALKAAAKALWEKHGERLVGGYDNTYDSLETEFQQLAELAAAAAVTAYFAVTSPTDTNGLVERQALAHLGRIVVRDSYGHPDDGGQAALAIVSDTITRLLSEMGEAERA